MSDKSSLDANKGSVGQAFKEDGSVGGTAQKMGRLPCGCSHILCTAGNPPMLMLGTLQVDHFPKTERWANNSRHRAQWVALHSQVRGPQLPCALPPRVEYLSSITDPDVAPAAEQAQGDKKSMFDKDGAIGKAFKRESAIALSVEFVD